jgi:hypothetical protein
VSERESARKREREGWGGTDRASVPGADNILFSCLKIQLTYLNLQLTYLNFVVLDEILNLLSSTTARNLILRASSQRNCLRVCYLNEQRFTSVASSRREEEVRRIVRICICQGLKGSSMRREFDEERLTKSTMAVGHNGEIPRQGITISFLKKTKKSTSRIYHPLLFAFASS